MGTDYIQLNKFATHQRGHSAGLVLQAFLGALQNYLHCYRATVLSVEGLSLQYVLNIFSFFFLVPLTCQCICQTQSFQDFLAKY